MYPNGHVPKWTCTELDHVPKMICNEMDLAMYWIGPCTKMDLLYRKWHVLIKLRKLDCTENDMYRIGSTPVVQPTRYAVNSPACLANMPLFTHVYALSLTGTFFGLFSVTFHVIIIKCQSQWTLCYSAEAVTFDSRQMSAYVCLVPMRVTDQWQ